MGGAFISICCAHMSLELMFICNKVYNRSYGTHSVHSVIKVICISFTYRTEKYRI